MLPLKGKKVLDFCKLLPGPLGTHFLAQLGAEVYKIERPNSQDYIRHQMPFIEDVSTLFYALNEGKKSIVFDFLSEAGRLELIKLIQEADFLLEQFRPGVMAHWGLDFETVKSINPKIIYISLTGYGQEGPMAQEAGHDLNYLSLAGVLDLLRDESGRPIIPGIQIADIAGGSYMMLSAALAGLLEVYRTNEGLYIDVAMTQGLFPLMTFPLSQLWGGVDQRLLKVLSGGLVNYNVYECADGKWVALGALELKFWESFCKATNRPNWSRKQLHELSIYSFPKEELEALFKERTRDEWATWAMGKDLCLTPVVEMDELDRTAQLLAKNYQTSQKENGLAAMKLPFG